MYMYCLCKTGNYFTRMIKKAIVWFVILLELILEFNILFNYFWTILMLTLHLKAKVHFSPKPNPLFTLARNKLPETFHFLQKTQKKYVSKCFWKLFFSRGANCRACLLCSWFLSSSSAVCFTFSPCSLPLLVGQMGYYDQVVVRLCLQKTGYTLETYPYPCCMKPCPQMYASTLTLTIHSCELVTSNLSFSTYICDLDWP